MSLKHNYVTVGNNYSSLCDNYVTYGVIYASFGDNCDVRGNYSLLYFSLATFDDNYGIFMTTMSLLVIIMSLLVTLITTLVTTLSFMVKFSDNYVALHDLWLQLC